MQMKGIANNYGLEEAIKLAVNDGVDIMCFSNNITGVENRTVDKVLDIIKKFVASGEIKKARIDESFKRIMKLKKSISIQSTQIQTLKAEVKKLNHDNQVAELERKNLEKVLTKKQKKKLN